jgi:predicted NBD/HSP70 family sugar kinase
MAVAEQHFGQGQGVDEFLHVSIGVGIGAAIFTSGKLHYGSDGFAGELGHITIDEHGEICSCGNRGCLEVCASAGAIISQARTRLQKGVDSLLFQLVEGNLERISVETVVEAAQAGDKLSMMILKEAAEHLGTALADVVNLLNPKKIILGGAVPKTAGKFLTEPLLVTIRERALPQVTQNLEVSISNLSDESAAVGAAILAAESLVLSDTSLRQLIGGRSVGRVMPHGTASRKAIPE